MEKIKWFKTEKEYNNWLKKHNGEDCRGIQFPKGKYNILEYHKNWVLYEE